MYGRGGKGGYIGRIALKVAGDSKDTKRAFVVEFRWVETLGTTAKGVADGRVGFGAGVDIDVDVDGTTTSAFTGVIDDAIVEGSQLVSTLNINGVQSLGDEQNEKA